MAEKKKIKITANDVETFKSIQDEFDKLPEYMQEGVVSAQKNSFNGLIEFTYNDLHKYQIGLQLMPDTQMIKILNDQTIVFGKKAMFIFPLSKYLVDSKNKLDIGITFDTKYVNKENEFNKLKE